MTKYVNKDLIIDWDEYDYINGFHKWKSPSNLAIIKYWGKFGTQYPQNPSLSLTLDAAHTTTLVEWYYGGEDEIIDIPGEEPRKWIEFYYNGESKPDFAKRIDGYLRGLKDIFPFLDEMSFIIRSKNSFPHSAGIASSASAMSALALSLCSIERNFFDNFESDEAFYKKASYVARLGSGSACRSLYGGWVQWGESEVDSKFSNDHGTPISDIHPSFRDMKDTILIASQEQKSVSSSAGHQLMEDNVYSAARYQQAKDRLPILIQALKEGDWQTFGEIAESEALTLHALMMCSSPSYILMHPNTLKMIDVIRAYRKETGAQVYFSLDAGPNIHMLYPSAIEEEIQKLIKHKLKTLCVGGQIIYDQVGFGPQELRNND